MSRRNAKEETQIKSRSQMASIWMRLKKNKMAMAGLFMLLAMILIAVFAGIIADYDTEAIQQNMPERMQTPSAKHWFGTDNFGRDVFARIIHGSRISLSMSIIAMAIAVAIGAVIGAIAGYYGGKTDNILMRFMDILLAIPPMLMSISIVAALGQSTGKSSNCACHSVYTGVCKSYPFINSFHKGSGIYRSSKILRQQ